MINKKYTIPTIVGFFALIVGLILGLIWKDLPLVKFNREVKLYEIFYFVLSVIVGAVYPFLIKKWIDDNRTIKVLIVDELKNILVKTAEIKTIIDTSANSGVNITQAQKDAIIQRFQELDMLFDSFQLQLSTSFSNSSESINKKILDAYIKYWRFSSSSQLMSSTFVMTPAFQSQHLTEYNLFTKEVKVLIHTIHKL